MFADIPNASSLTDANALFTSSSSSFNEYLGAASGALDACDIGLCELVRHTFVSSVERASLLDHVRAVTVDIARSCLDAAAAHRTEVAAATLREQDLHQQLSEARTAIHSIELLRDSLQEKLETAEREARDAREAMTEQAARFSRYDFEEELESEREKRSELLASLEQFVTGDASASSSNAEHEAAPAPRASASLVRRRTTAISSLLGAEAAASATAAAEDAKLLSNNDTSASAPSSSSSPLSSSDAASDTEASNVLYRRLIDFLSALRKAMSATDTACAPFFDTMQFAQPEIHLAVARFKWMAIAEAVGKYEVEAATTNANDDIDNEAVATARLARHIRSLGVSKNAPQLKNSDITTVLSETTVTMREIALRLVALADSPRLQQLAKAPMMPPMRPRDSCPLCFRVASSDDNGKFSGVFSDDDNVDGSTSDARQRRRKRSNRRRDVLEDSIVEAVAQPLREELQATAERLQNVEEELETSRERVTSLRAKIRELETQRQQDTAVAHGAVPASLIAAAVASASSSSAAATAASTSNQQQQQQGLTAAPSLSAQSSMITLALPPTGGEGESNNKQEHEQQNHEQRSKSPPLVITLDIKCRCCDETTKKSPKMPSYARPKGSGGARRPSALRRPSTMIRTGIDEGGSNSAVFFADEQQQQRGATSPSATTRSASGTVTNNSRSSPSALSPTLTNPTSARRRTSVWASGLRSGRSGGTFFEGDKKDAAATNTSSNQPASSSSPSDGTTNANTNANAALGISTPGFRAFGDSSADDAAQGHSNNNSNNNSMKTNNNEDSQRVPLPEQKSPTDLAPLTNTASASSMLNQNEDRRTSSVVDPPAALTDTSSHVKVVDLVDEAASEQHPGISKTPTYASNASLPVSPPLEPSSAPTTMGPAYPHAPHASAPTTITATTTTTTVTAAPKPEARLIPILAPEREEVRYRFPSMAAVTDLRVLEALGSAHNALLSAARSRSVRWLMQQLTAIYKSKLVSDLTCDYERVARFGFVEFVVAAPRVCDPLILATRSRNRRRRALELQLPLRVVARPQDAAQHAWRPQATSLCRVGSAPGRRQRLRRRCGDHAPRAVLHRRTRQALGGPSQNGASRSLRRRLLLRHAPSSSNAPIRPKDARV